MNNAYQNIPASQSYESFLGSPYGQEFRQILGQNFLKELACADHEPSSTVSVLDAGCGDGWLSGLLSQTCQHAEVHAIDLSEYLVDKGQAKYPKVKFQIADLTVKLPFPEDRFDYIAASMVLHDVESEAETLQNLAYCLKPSGKILASIVNPYYGFPIGVWKRGLVGRLLGRLPQLKLVRPYNRLKNQTDKRFTWKEQLYSNFTPLALHLTNFQKAGLYLEKITELESQNDSPSFDLSYQLYRYPIILLLTLKKFEKQG